MRVLLVAATTGYQTRSFEEAAARLGIELVYATDRCHALDDPWQDHAIAVRFHDLEPSVDAIVTAARTRPFDGILAVGDRPTLIAARAAAALGLPGHPFEAAAAAANKLRTRERLRQAQLPIPWFLATSLAVDAEQLARSIPYPCVIKPLALSGSRGVMRADDPHTFVIAFDRLRALLESLEVRAEQNEAHTAVLIEGFIPGREYAVEGVLDDGVLQVLAIFDKPDPLDGPFFEETLYITPSRASGAEQTAIVSAIDRAARALGLEHGPVHAECRANEHGVFVLEVAARPIGGLCARALRFRQVDCPRSQSASVISLEELLLRQAIGESPCDWIRESHASGVMMVPIPRHGVLRSVEGVEAAERVSSVTAVRITAKPDQVLVPLPEGASYLGFIFAEAASPTDVEAALRQAHAYLSFRIDPQIPVYNRAHG